MTDKEILKKAFKKALKEDYNEEVADLFDVEDFLHAKADVLNTPDGIFSHKFAKVFWGEDFINDDNVCKDEDQDSFLVDAYVNSNMKIWQYHLQRMVLEENPVEYLKKFL